MIKGIYIHIPFCNIKCPYCDFVSFINEDEQLYKRYVNAILKELSFYQNENFNVHTVYFGGGTPSVLKPELIDKIISYIKNQFDTIKNPEITMEINPKTYKENDFYEIANYGVNRISIGSQSFLRKNLQSLGRDHQPIDVLKTVEYTLKSGINNISLDMIYGISGQTLNDLQKDLEIYTSLPIKHISAYMLTAYEDTPLGKMVEKQEYQMPDEDITTLMFEKINNYFESKGFFRYELSNWAKSDFESRHNLLYWEDGQFLGVGLSAWSYIGNKRFGNVKNINEYLKRVENDKRPVEYSEILDEREKEREKIFLGLRLSKGIDIRDFESVDIFEELSEQKLGLIDNNRFKLTLRGLMVINEVARKLIQELNL